MKKIDFIEEIKLDSVDELFDYISPWGKLAKLDEFVFRGESSDTFKLLPKALRENEKENFLNITKSKEDEYHSLIYESYQRLLEEKLLKRFYHLADKRGLEVPIAQKIRNYPSEEMKEFLLHCQGENSEWIPSELYEVASLAQHYGIHTRLLDWTYDIYVAMFFAFKGAIDKEQTNLVIWALNKEKLSRLEGSEVEVNVKFITPHYSRNPNLNAQQGLFTHWPISSNKIFQLHQHKEDRIKNNQLVDRTPLDDLIFNYLSKFEDRFLENIFKKFTLPSSEAKKGMEILARMGYDYSKIFPGYQGIADTIANEYKY